ncbi:MAG: hypothetical protein HY240_11335 [Actinobacteria bacterium]|nr:hypothetical protein [Actinomycetota bacterium]
MTRQREHRRLVLPVAIGLVLGLAGGASAAFWSTTVDLGNTLSAAADLTSPTVSRSVIMRTTGSVPGAIKQGGLYYVFAQVTDSGNPASGVASVTADLTAVTTGAGSVALSAGSFTAGSLSYNYRSAAQTANNPLAAGAKTYSITAADAATPANSTTSGGWTVTVDNTAPTGVDIQTADAGATVGKAETGDTITWTFSEQIDPVSILAGWTGAATTVTVRITNSGCAPNDSLTVLDSAGTTTLPLGTPCLGGVNYVTATRTFTSSTMVQTGSSITVTLGTPSGAVGTQATSTTMTWTPSSSALDPAGNACSTAAVTESGASDVEF